jgi:hypothetical protein
MDKRIRIKTVNKKIITGEGGRLGILFYIKKSLLFTSIALSF